MRNRVVAVIATAAAAASVVTGCGSSSSGSSSASTGTVKWWTWDDKQAAAYQKCATAFEKANPGDTVQISQYDVSDYFTKLTAGFVAGDAPDAFQNSVQYFQAYASQNQLLPLDDLIKKTGYNLSQFSVGVNAWKYTDGKQYGLPLDWAATAVYYNQDMLTQAGYTQQDVDNLTWNPDDGGTFDKMVAHLTIDKNGKRGDQPGFDKNHIATYGVGVLNSDDFIGQTTWSSFVSTLGWQMGDKASWPTVFNYNDPRLVKTMDYIKSLAARGFMPGFGQFTGANGQNSVSDVTQLGSGKVALETAGSWEAATFTKLPGVHVGIAPTVLGPDGKTRKVLSNSNGDNIWAGTKNPDLTWKWVSYMGSAPCQTLAGASGTFFPSIPSAMEASAQAMKAQGVDWSVFTQYQKDGSLYPAVVYGAGAAMQQAEQPLLDAYFDGSRGDDVFAEMQTKSKSILAGD
ncbi:MAG TPA: sugar ABC transporter substrate-binding protein [Actinocrinis sp.]|jgi:multiple sugar transport system substrate-binding protein|uniref:ABC transporter substrate-binding protein n=1 Tax=Actinocrinis sp. TaxID=1920516 RepID=UPI002DDCC819|nr:sugar ABC transporter substrate-binding protein [Actinocrinis sp.]HEV3170731.1 sugar ABC transporter substrate-binding protein [Actinocrinis sp.]